MMAINSVIVIVNGRSVAVERRIEMLDVPRNQLETTQQVAAVTPGKGRSRHGVSIGKRFSAVSGNVQRRQIESSSRKGVRQ
jgi:hypothetical protein